MLKATFLNNFLNKLLHRQATVDHQAILESESRAAVYFGNLWESQWDLRDRLLYKRKYLLKKFKKQALNALVGDCFTAVGMVK